MIADIVPFFLMARIILAFHAEAQSPIPYQSGTRREVAAQPYLARDLLHVADGVASQLIIRQRILSLESRERGHYMKDTQGHAQWRSFGAILSLSHYKDIRPSVICNHYECNRLRGCSKTYPTVLINPFSKINANASPKI